MLDWVIVEFREAHSLFWNQEQLERWQIHFLRSFEPSAQFRTHEEWLLAPFEHFHSEFISSELHDFCSDIKTIELFSFWSSGIVAVGTNVIVDVVACVEKTTNDEVAPIFKVVLSWFDVENPIWQSFCLIGFQLQFDSSKVVNMNLEEKSYLYSSYQLLP